LDALFGCIGGTPWLGDNPVGEHSNLNTANGFRYQPKNDGQVTAPIISGIAGSATARNAGMSYIVPSVLPTESWDQNWLTFWVSSQAHR
jgi:hypothetical protein